MGMINVGQTVTNAPGTGLDENGNLLPGYKYATYSNGVGQGTPQKIGDVGLLGQTVTASGGTPQPSGTSVVGGTAPGVSTGSGAPTPPATSDSLNAAARARVGVPPGGVQGDGMIGATQTPWTVTSDQTVAGQAQKLMDPNNPLNVAAVANANMAANEKGLQNSSMAVTAGQQAVLDNALKIAGADAATNAAAAQSNATQANSLSATNATLANQRWTANLDATTKTNLAQIEANYKGLMQTSGSAADLWRSTMSLMGGVMTDPNMDSASKQNALNNMVASLSTGLQVLGTINGIDFGNLLQF